MTKLNYELLGDRIRTEREKQKMTQSLLAEYCSLSISHIGHIERGTRIPSLDTILKISEVLNLSIDYLVLGSNDLNNHNISPLNKLFDELPKEKQSSIIKILKFIINSEPI